ncbi:MAG: right-handed parallel beta-helix repeat-containing protein [Rickettsiales bacterium]
MNKRFRLFFLTITFSLALPVITFANQDKSHSNVQVDTLDPTNDNYLQKFCAYHPRSGICIITPNPPAHPPFTPPGQGSDSNVIIGGGSPANPPPPPAECTSATANTSSIASAITMAKTGKAAVLPPGSYGRMALSGSFGGGTIKCAQPGKCNLGNSDVNGASNLTLEGFTVRGGGVGITVTSSRNVAIRCSNFIEQTSSGILINQGGSGSDQIKIHLNNFMANSSGCHVHEAGVCGTLSNGTPIASMDYGIRIYDAGVVDIQKNTFGTLFNHSISAKANVAYTYVSGNTFNKCGRNCIEPGQEPNTTRYPNRTSGEMVIVNNTFNDVIKTATVLLVKNVRKVTFTGNRLNNVQGRLLNMYSFKPGEAWSSGGTVIGTGVPADRQVIR